MHLEEKLSKKSNSKTAYKANQQVPGQRLRKQKPKRK